MTNAQYREEINSSISDIRDEGALAFLYETSRLKRSNDDGSLNKPLKSLLILLLLEDFYDIGFYSSR